MNKFYAVDLTTLSFVLSHYKLFQLLLRFMKLYENCLYFRYCLCCGLFESDMQLPCLFEINNE